MQNGHGMRWWEVTGQVTAGIDGKAVDSHLKGTWKNIPQRERTGPEALRWAALGVCVEQKEGSSARVWTGWGRGTRGFGALGDLGFYSLGDGKLPEGGTVI